MVVIVRQVGNAVEPVDQLPDCDLPGGIQPSTGGKFPAVRVGTTRTST